MVRTRRKNYPVWFVGLVLVCGLLHRLLRFYELTDKPELDHAPVSVCSEGAPPQDVFGTVDRVIDGDTLDVRMGSGRLFRVRLLCIDTPERGEKGYEEASDSLRQMCPPGTAVEVFPDPGMRQTDDFGRVLAYVWRNNECVNVEQVRRGHSEYITKFGRSCMEKRFIEVVKQ